MAIQLDENDPCATAASLKQVYAQIVAGASAQTVTFRGGPNGTERSVTYHRADASALLVLVREYEQKCAALTSGKPRR